VLTCSNQPGDSVVSTNTSNTLGRPKAYYLGKAEFGGEVGGASKRRRCTAAPRSLTPRGRLRATPTCGAAGSQREAENDRPAAKEHGQTGGGAAYTGDRDGNPRLVIWRRWCCFLRCLADEICGGVVVSGVICGGE
jgi:hypothetical protein